MLKAALLALLKHCLKIIGKYTATETLVERGLWRSSTPASFWKPDYHQCWLIGQLWLWSSPASIQGLTPLPSQTTPSSAAPPSQWKCFCNVQSESPVCGPNCMLYHLPAQTDSVLSFAPGMSKSSQKSMNTPSSLLLPLVYTVLSSQSAVKFVKDLPLVYLSVFM